MSDGEYREAGTGGLSLDKRDDEMTRQELRGSILAELGYNEPWYTPLSKRALNSLHAYLTGSYYVPKWALYRPDHAKYAPRREVLLAVVWLVPIGEPEDRWSPVTSGYPSELRRDELQTLREAMDDTVDQRQFW